MAFTSRIGYFLLLLFVVIIMFLFYEKPYQSYKMVIETKLNDQVNRIDNKKIADREQIYEETFSNEWLNRSNSEIFRNYLNSDSCSRDNRNRKVFIDMFRHWIKLAESLGIRYFLTDGSLLGAWRDGDVIPYDYDLDIRVHIDDLQKLFPLRQKKLSWNPVKEKGNHIYFTRDWRLPLFMRRRFTCEGEQIQEYNWNKCAIRDPPVRLINAGDHIDVFVYQTYENVLQFFPYEPMEFVKSDFFPLVKCSLLNETTWCPRNPKPILDQMYNNKLYPKKICINGRWVEKKD